MITQRATSRAGCEVSCRGPVRAMVWPPIKNKRFSSFSCRRGPPIIGPRAFVWKLRRLKLIPPAVHLLSQAEIGILLHTP